MSGISLVFLAVFVPPVIKMVVHKKLDKTGHGRHSHKYGVYVGEHRKEDNKRNSMSCGFAKCTPDGFRGAVVSSAIIKRLINYLIFLCDNGVDVRCSHGFAVYVTNDGHSYLDLTVHGVFIEVRDNTFKYQRAEKECKHRCQHCGERRAVFENGKDRRRHEYTDKVESTPCYN